MTENLENLIRNTTTSDIITIEGLNPDDIRRSPNETLPQPDDDEVIDFFFKLASYTKDYLESDYSKYNTFFCIENGNEKMPLNIDWSSIPHLLGISPINALNNHSINITDHIKYLLGRSKIKNIKELFQMIDIISNNDTELSIYKEYETTDYVGNNFNHTKAVIHLFAFLNMGTFDDDYNEKNPWGIKEVITKKSEKAYILERDTLTYVNGNPYGKVRLYIEYDENSKYFIPKSVQIIKPNNNGLYSQKMLGNEFKRGPSRKIRIKKIN